MQRTVLVTGHPAAGTSTLVAALAGTAPDTGPPRLVAAGCGPGLALLDVPGDPDLPGERDAALRVADALLLVLAPSQGLAPLQVQVWERAADAGLPRLVALTRLDDQGADTDDAVALCQRLLGEECLPVALPLLDDDERVAGLLDLLDGQLHDSSSGHRTSRRADAEHLRLVRTVREDLVEALLADSDDDALLSAHLRGDRLPAAALQHSLVAAVARGAVCPVVPVVPGRDVGVVELRSLLAALPPRPLRHGPALLRGAEPVEAVLADPSGPLVLEGVAHGIVAVRRGTLPGAVLLDGSMAEAPAPMLVRGALAAGVLQPADLALAHPVPPPALPLVAVPGVDAAVAEDPAAQLVDGVLWCSGPGHAAALAARVGAELVPATGLGAVTLVVDAPLWCARAAGRLLAGADQEDAPDGVRYTVQVDGDGLSTLVAALRDASGGTARLSRVSPPT